MLHPTVVASVTWFTVVLLYSFHLSGLLLFPTSAAIETSIEIVVPIIAASIAYRLLQRVDSGSATSMVHWELAPGVIERRLRLGMYVWMLFTIIETWVSGGVPLLWLLTGSGKSNFDYGIPSVHGMLNALLLALAVTSFLLYLYTDNRRHLWFPIFAIAWSLVLVSRGTLFVLLLEFAVVYLRLRKVRGKTIMRLIAIVLIVVLVFGYVGDVRSGAEAFRNLAEPTDKFPNWAPSGLLWAYIYITTPINNLLLTRYSLRPSFNLSLPDTAATLFPTPLRNLIYGKEGSDEAISGALENNALNVSTAYVGPYQDMGIFGIIGFSLVAGLLCEIYWHRKGFLNILFFSVFTQTLVLSLFYNLLFSLPILGQLVWFFYFARTPKRVAPSAEWYGISGSRLPS